MPKFNLNEWRIHDFPGDGGPTYYSSNFFLKTAWIWRKKKIGTGRGESKFFCVDPLSIFLFVEKLTKTLWI